MGIFSEAFVCVSFFLLLPSGVSLNPSSQNHRLPTFFFLSLSFSFFPLLNYTFRIFLAQIIALNKTFCFARLLCSSTFLSLLEETIFRKSTTLGFGSRSTFIEICHFYWKIEALLFCPFSSVSINKRPVIKWGEEVLLIFFLASFSDSPFSLSLSHTHNIAASQCCPSPIPLCLFNLFHLAFSVVCFYFETANLLFLLKSDFNYLFRTCLLTGSLPMRSCFLFTRFYPNPQPLGYFTPTTMLPLVSANSFYFVGVSW